MCVTISPNEKQTAFYETKIIKCGLFFVRTDCDAHLAESLFQTRSNGAYILLIYMFTVFSDMRTVRSEVIL